MTSTRSRDLPGTHSQVSRDAIREAGQSILQKYCSSENDSQGPIMIPPIPDSKFIDKLHENEVTVDRNVVNYRGHRDGYEAEVKLYRSFEKLGRNLLVIHRLEYTHGQYSAFLADHPCKNKNCKGQLYNKDGECDFVVVGENFVAVFEVKASTLKNLDRDENGKKERFEVCCDSAIKQRNKIIKLIKSIDSSVMTFGFTVFNNMSKNDLVSIGLEKECGDLLFSDDLTNFAGWFDENLTVTPRSITNPMDNLAVMEEIKCCLLGLWCMDNKNGCDETKCNFAKCVKDVDENLRMAMITENEVKKKNLLASGLGPRKRKTTSSGKDNDEIQDSSDIFKKYLNIQCLSKGQQEIFDSNERFLWVNGPAGSGKTVVMLAKILQIIRKPQSEKKIILMCPDLIDCTAVRRHQGFLDEIKDVPYELIEAVNTDVNRLESQIAQSNFKVMLLKSRLSKSGSFIELLRNLIELLQGSYHIIVDDFQLDKFWTDSSGQPDVITGFIKAMKDVKERSNDNISVWVFCDLAQQVLYETLYQARRIEMLNEDHRNKLKSSFMIKSLEVNLRNTCDISLLLSLIRNEFTNMVQSSMAIANHEVGHFLRGTKPVFYLIEELTHDLTSNTSILRKEIKKLDGLGNNDIGVLYSDRTNFDHNFLDHPQDRHQQIGTKESEEMTRGRKHIDTNTISETLSNVVKETCTTSTIDIERIEDSWSAEWPAVIAIIHGSVLWTELYLAVSRARVHCSVIILGSGSGSDAGVFLKELEQIHDVCRVISVSEKSKCLDS